MSATGLRALYGYRTQCGAVDKSATVIPNHGKPQFSVTRPNGAGAADVTDTGRGWAGSTWRS